ncbi:aromatic amino acid exporter YddG [Oceanomicrobium pacificus]|uniref:EamA family transporter n=1 Tax=Oceanomicrobium pacificus TaxID=2692916 RepID=A0A6B0TYM0_9RHOB|nr:DMT family transporter [Oceanomicrobium pacificus]MXU64001.1 EamA family transporter [Oceanomicrobium pacificus]
MSRTRATALGFGAVLLWAVLALFTVGATEVPPLQLLAVCFLTGGLVGLPWLWRDRTALGRVRPAVWLMGVAGIFGYHFAYVMALRLAPPAQASLIAYLWPLLIVLFSGLLPGEHLRRGHVLGALVAFAGAALIVGRGASGPAAAPWAGYAAAMACAFIWSGYSVLSRRAGTAPTASVAVFCLLSALLAAAAHLMFEATVWPETLTGWLSMLALGLGPIGLAFYLWDIGVKRGDIQLLGVAAYAAPLLSTLVLIGAGLAEPSPGLLLAAGLIAGGAFWAARA